MTIIAMQSRSVASTRDFFNSKNACLTIRIHFDSSSIQVFDINSLSLTVTLLCGAWTPTAQVHY